MLVKTKKYKLEERTYIRLAMRNLLREQWWVFLIAIGIISLTFFIKTVWFFIVSIIGLIGYSLFWLLQFYGVTQMVENKILFDRLGYEINSQQLLIQIDTKRGMPILWEKVKRVIQKADAFLVVISKTHLVYLPYKIFHNANEIKFLETILKRKNLLKK
jgi:hypothetical protein